MEIIPFSQHLQSSIPCPFSSSIPRLRPLSHFDRTLLSQFEILTTMNPKALAKRVIHAILEPDHALVLELASGALLLAWLARLAVE